MKANLDLYYVFYVVAKEGSVTNASKVLYVSQPAITLQIKKLEDLLRISLFTRTKHGMVLTDEGNVLFEYVKNGINNIINGENIISSLKELDTGSIRIGVSTTICRYVLMSYLETFHELYPKVDIQIINNKSEVLLKELRNGNLDMIMLFSPACNNKDLKIYNVLEVNDIFVTSKKYSNLINKKIKLDDLNSYPLIFLSNQSSSRNCLNKYLKDYSIDLKPKLEVVSFNLIVDLIKTGFGIGFVTKEFIKDEIDKELLYEINVSPVPPKRDIVIATIDKKEYNPCVKKLIELLVKKTRII